MKDSSRRATSKNGHRRPHRSFSGSRSLVPLPQPITLNLSAALAQGDPNLAGVQPGQTAAILVAEVTMNPHGPVSERFMRHHYGASGFVKRVRGGRVTPSPPVVAPAPPGLLSRGARRGEDARR
jgi:hypothetical protein